MIFLSMINFALIKNKIFIRALKFMRKVAKHLVRVGCIIPQEKGQGKTIRTLVSWRQGFGIQQGTSVCIGSPKSQEKWVGFFFFFKRKKERKKSLKIHLPQGGMVLKNVVFFVRSSFFNRLSNIPEPRLGFNFTTPQRHHHTRHPNQCVLLFGLTQCNISSY